MAAVIMFLFLTIIAIQKPNVVYQTYYYCYYKLALSFLTKYRTKQIHLYSASIEMFLKISLFSMKLQLSSYNII